MMRLAALLLCLAGCQARFFDLRPASTSASGDLGDGGEGSDGGAIVGLLPGVYARGQFMGRAGHAGSGTATLERAGDGSVELVFGDDFMVTAVPGPVVVLTSRPDLGTRLDAADLDLGSLQKTTGAQRYRLPGGDGGRGNAFVFCRPFGIEVAKAVLEPLP